MKPQQIVQHASNFMDRKKPKPRKNPRDLLFVFVFFCSRNVAEKCPNTFLEKEGLRVVSNGCLVRTFFGFSSGNLRRNRA